MTEHLTHLLPEHTESTTQDIPTGLMLLEQGEREQPLSKEDIDRLRNVSADLRTMNGGIYELENGAIRLGFQEIIDNYGMDALIAALGNTGLGAGEAPERLYKNLEPKRRDRKELLDGINGTPVDEIVRRLHNASGGLVENVGGNSVDSMQRGRRFTVGRGWRKRNNDAGGVDGGLWQLAQSRPELLSQDGEHTDLAVMIKNLTDTYNSESSEHNVAVDAAKEQLAAEIAEKQAPVAELAEFSDDLFSGQIQSLETALMAVDDESPKADLIQERLDDLAQQAQQKRSEYQDQLDAIAKQITDELGANHLDSLKKRQLEAQPILEGAQWDWDDKLAAGR